MSSSLIVLILVLILVPIILFISSKIKKHGIIFYIGSFLLLVSPLFLSFKHTSSETNSNDWTSFFAFAIVFGALLRIAQKHNAYRIRAWAGASGYEVLSYRGATFSEGPHSYLRSEYQDTFFVKLKKSNGELKSAWLTFGSYWGLSLNHVSVVFEPSN